MSKRGVDPETARIDDEVFLDRVLRPNADLLGEIRTAIGDVDEIFARVQLHRGLGLLQRLQELVAAVLGGMPMEDAPDDAGGHGRAAFAQIGGQRHGCGLAGGRRHGPCLRRLGIARIRHGRLGPLVLDGDILTLHHGRGPLVRLGGSMRRVPGRLCEPQAKRQSEYRNGQHPERQPQSAHVQPPGRNPMTKAEARSCLR